MIEQILHVADFIASDGLLTIFFFTIGLELAEEIRNGDLRDARHASLPALAAVGGVLMPAGVFASIVLLSGLPSHLLSGWAIPTATDIAFSLAVLAFFGSRLRPGVKLFLLVLAVVDDIIGIVIIAIAFSKNINAFALLSVVVLIVLWTIAIRQEKITLWLVWILAIGAWSSMVLSGIHPTIAGVLLGVTTPASKFATTIKSHKTKTSETKNLSRAKYIAGRFEFTSNRVVVPIFAITSIVISAYELGHAFVFGEKSPSSHDLSLESMIPLAIAVALALIVGKPVGILLFAWIGQHLTPLKLFHGLRVRNLIGVSALGGIGFTVSFLVASISFDNPTEVAIARLGVLIGSILSAILGFIIIKVSMRDKH